MPAWPILLTEILEEKLQMELLLESSLSSPLATLSALQRFDFFWTPAAMETR